MKRNIVIFILIFSVFLMGSYYEVPFEKQFEAVEKSKLFEALPKEAESILETIGIDGFDIESISSVSFFDIIRLIYESILIKIKEPFIAVAAITASAIICAIAKSFEENFSETGKIIDIISVLSAFTIFLVPIKNVMVSSAEIIDNCSDFILAFIPVYSSAVAASGYVTAATGFHSLMLATVTLISQISSELIAPLICIFLALTIAGSISEINIGEISKSVKNFAVWILGLLMTIFSAVMGLGTLISSSTDGALSKTAKFIIGSTVPIIGSTVSEAFLTVKSCIVVTKNFLGIYAIIAIFIIFLPSIISLFSWKICLSIASVIGGISENKTITNLLSSASSVLGIMLALVIVTAIVFIFSVSIILLVGGT